VTAAPARLDVEGRLGRITLSAPERGNVIDFALMLALGDAVRAAAAAEVSVLLIEAEGRAFSVGGDVASFADAPDPGKHVALLAEALHGVISALVRLPAIVVTVVRGTAAGAGVSLAAAGDLVLAASTARFVLAYTRLGLSPDGGSTLLPASLGLHRALRLALLNPLLSATEAQAAGLVAEVHQDDDLDAGVERVVTALLAGSRDAQVATKRLLRAQSVPAPETAMAAEAVSISRLASVPDGREGVAAFLAKRPAHFPSSA
jgi:2-(1,2-epoxy-1,2-dihydrophenyl)acetyl-CoA isomerase